MGTVVFIGQCDRPQAHCRWGFTLLLLTTRGGQKSGARRASPPAGWPGPSALASPARNKSGGCCSGGRACRRPPPSGAAAAAAAWLRARDCPLARSPSLPPPRLPRPPAGPAGEGTSSPSARTGTGSAWQLAASCRPLLMILPQVHLRKPCYDFYFL